MVDKTIDSCEDSERDTVAHSVGYASGVDGLVLRLVLLVLRLQSAQVQQESRANNAEDTVADMVSCSIDRVKQMLPTQSSYCTHMRGVSEANNKRNTALTVP